MYDISGAFKESFSKRGREGIRSRITIGTDVFENDLIKGIDWSDGIILDDNFEIGTATMSTATIKIANKGLALGYGFENKEIKVEIGIKIDSPLQPQYASISYYASDSSYALNPYEFVPLGLFTIEKSHLENETELKLSGVDRMYKMETPYVCSKTFPCTLGDIVSDICNEADVPLLSNVFVNSDYVIETKPSFKDDLTCRKAIMAVAELAGGFAKITRDGKLAIINSDANISTTQKYASDSAYVSDNGWLIYDELIEGTLEISRNNYVSFNNKELPLNRIDSVVIGNIMRGAGDNPITINPDNIFLQDPSKVIDNLYNVLKDFSYYPFTMEWQGNPAIDCGDKLTILGKNGARFNTIATSRTMSFNGGMSEEYTAVGKSTTEANSTPTGDTTIEIKHARSDLQEYTDDAVAKLAGNKGGYVYFKRNEDGTPSEIYVMDTPSPENAKKCIRINQEGIGGSTTGINGPFNVSMLIDGTLNAEMVVTGTMIADRIKGGILTLGGLNNENGQLIMVDKDGNEIGRWDKDGIKVEHSDGSYTMLNAMGLKRYVGTSQNNYSAFIYNDYINDSIENISPSGDFANYGYFVVSKTFNIALPDEYKGIDAKKIQISIDVTSIPYSNGLYNSAVNKYWDYSTNNDFISVTVYFNGIVYIPKYVENGAYVALTTSASTVFSINFTARYQLIN